MITVKEQIFDVAQAQLKPDLPACLAGANCGSEPEPEIKRFLILFPRRVILRNRFANVPAPA